MLLINKYSQTKTVLNCLYSLKYFKKCPLVFLRKLLLRIILFHFFLYVGNLFLSFNDRIILNYLIFRRLVDDGINLNQ